MSTKETLIKAKEILIERGVNRDGSFVNQTDGCKVCAIGAVKLALGGRVVPGGVGFKIAEPEGRSERERFLAEQGVAWLALENGVIAGSRGEWVPYWNDQSTSDQEVLDGFDRTIAMVEATS